MQIKRDNRQRFTLGYIAWRKHCRAYGALLGITGHHHAEQASPFMALSTGRKGGGRASRFGGGWFKESQQTLGQRGHPWLSDLPQGN